jgi:hypothetical protein
VDPKSKTTNAELAPWISFLKRSGLGGIVASLGEAASPLAPIVAQILHVAQPLVASDNAKQSLQDLVTKLEDPQQEQST